MLIWGSHNYRRILGMRVIVYSSLYLSSVGRGNHINKLYNILARTSEAFVRSLPPLAVDCCSRSCAAAGASWNVLTSKGSWTHARTAMCTRAHTKCSHPLVSAERAREHSARDSPERTETSVHEKKYVDTRTVNEDYYERESCECFERRSDGDAVILCVRVQR